jgi:hypothetical protein
MLVRDEQWMRYKLLTYDRNERYSSILVGCNVKKFAHFDVILNADDTGVNAYSAIWQF